ncbi:MAG: hypothetical protein MJ191_04315, partial [Clostridium sp.]|nr:hypothetical protein [Clostridium sp.]
MQEGYDLECYNPIKDNEKTLSINYILEKIRSMGAVKQYFYEEIVEFKEFNLPPLIIGDKGYGLTLEDLAYPLHKLYDKDVSKAIIINSKYENMRYNQIYYLMKKLDYELAEKLENVSLGLIKINENLKKYTRNNNDIIKLL